MTTYLGKSCSFCLPRVPFVNCRQFMYSVISLLVLRAGYGIWLYQFLNIAYLLTLCYVIPDNSSRQSTVETNIFDRLLDSVVFIENKSQGNCNLLLCGDSNSRTSNYPGFIVDDGTMHMLILPDDYLSVTQMPWSSEDEGHINNNGLLLLDFCKQTGLRIMNGRVGNDQGIHICRE